MHAYLLIGNAENTGTHERSQRRAGLRNFMSSIVRCFTGDICLVIGELHRVLHMRQSYRAGGEDRRIRIRRRV
jgi:hypothetical protein